MGPRLSMPQLARFLAVLALLPTGGANAEGSGFAAERAFPVAGACYGRRYDADHIARHPGQVVSAIHLSGSSRGLIRLRPQADRIDPELDLTLRIAFTDGGRAEGEIGCVETGGRIRRCGRGASCAGSFAVDLLPDGRLRIVNDDAESRLDRPVVGAPGFSPDATCRGSGRFVPPDAQNRVFLLTRLPLSACGPQPTRD
ncbi:hypothetical protein MPPM_0834 [Methylorubrum populi]|uniref:Uncharacterized protein n=2 Tax=Methylorubrum populi TaxID=223967 RepID=A0A160P9U3_9HYPH|nr:hypothetical protein MPPM_0834 [Methylorubrum populi]